MKQYLITLSSPIAVRNSDGQTKLINVVEAYLETAHSRDEIVVRVRKWWDSAAQVMRDTKLVDLVIKRSNIRSRQEVC